MVLLAACGFFVLGAYGGVNVVLASFYPDDLRAVGIGWAKSVGRIGTLIAPVLIGAGLSAGIDETTIMSLFALPALLAVASLGVIAMAERRAAPIGARSARRPQRRESVEGSRIRAYSRSKSKMSSPFGRCMPCSKYSSQTAAQGRP